jgi:hypothetical protein
MISEKFQLDTWIKTLGFMFVNIGFGNYNFARRQSFEWHMQTCLVSKKTEQLEERIQNSSKKLQIPLDAHKFSLFSVFWERLLKKHGPLSLEVSSD